jgi:hypothetical protein
MQQRQISKPCWRGFDPKIFGSATLAWAEYGLYLGTIPD